MRHAETAADVDRPNLDQTLDQTLDRTSPASPATVDGGLSAVMQSRMDHTIRTPMTAILGFADLLESDLPEGEGGQAAELREAVRTIKRNGRHLLEIMGTILDMSGIEAGRVTAAEGETETVAVCLSVLDAVRDQAAAKSLGQRAVFRGPVPATIRTDAGRLTQLLTTLAANAVRFTDAGGVELRVSAQPGSDELRFDVIDSGIGMTTEQATHLASPGLVPPAPEQASVGLGLHLCHAYAALLGGRVAVRSQLGAGSRVGLALSLSALRCGDATVEAASLEPTAGPAGASSEFLPLAGARVLLVEDGVDNQVLLRLLLRRAGADVELAADGLEALEHAEHANDDFDLVLMDMHMPNLDGYGATARLREGGCTLPIIALTAMAMAGDRERCLRAGCDDYLSKPIDRRLLLDTCKRWMLGDLVRA